MYVHVIRQYSRYVIRSALRVIKLHRAQGHTVHPNWKGTEYTCPVQQHLFDATVIFPHDTLRIKYLDWVRDDENGIHSRSSLLAGKQASSTNVQLTHTHTSVSNEIGAIH